MPVYLTALIEALVYLGAVPVCAAFCLGTGDRPCLGVGISLFSPGAALRAARKRPLRAKPSGPKIGLPRLWRALRRLRMDTVVLEGRLCLGDAAATAMACGALTALTASLGTRAARLEIKLAPDFESSAMEVALQGMIRARFGQIMIAAASGELTNIKGKISAWTDTRLKALWPPPWKTSEI